MIEQCAAEGKRCPENSTHGVGHGLIPMLAMQGRVRIEISGSNFRRVTLLTGQFAGKSTAPDPSESRVWKVLDKDGMLINGKRRFYQRKSDRPQPSMPRIA